MTGIELIAEKARTNRDHKGYTAGHDDVHDKGELVTAAQCYIVHAWLQISYRPPLDIPPMWPFEDDAWKPSDDPIRNLVAAGALIIAEIERLQRVKG